MNGLPGLGSGASATPPPSIEAVASKHAEEIEALWTSEWDTSGGEMDAWLNDSIDEHQNEVGFVAVDHAGDGVVGFAFATHVPLTDDDGREWAYGYVSPAEDAIGDDWNDIGMMHLSVVAPDRRGEGIGRRLFQARLGYLQHYVDGVVGFSWHREGRGSDRLFEAAGFEAFADLESYYDDERDCPQCDGHCVCDATLYRREI